MDKKEFLEILEWKLKCECEEMQKSHDRIIQLKEMIEEYNNKEE